MKKLKAFVMVAAPVVVFNLGYCMSGMKKGFIAFYIVALLVALGLVIWWIKKR